MTFLGLDARFQAFRFGRTGISWDSSRPLYARYDNVTQKISVGDVKPHYFFRLHFVLRGELSAGRDAPIAVRLEGASSRGGEILVPLYFPVCGRLDIRGRLLIRDVFGLVRARVGEEEARSLRVLAPIFPDKPRIEFRSLAKPESSRRRQNADEEKYYMREYIPGDRLKDINWKASMRLSELITRISPLSFEESRMLHVDFRHFNPNPSDTARSILHLNYVKSWMLSFLYRIKQDHAEYNFAVQTSDDLFELESIEDIDRFAGVLSTLSFRPDTSSALGDRVPGRERFIFTTAYDAGLSAFLAAHPGCHFHIFRTVFGPRYKSRLVRFFDTEQPLSLPGAWVLRRDNTVPAPLPKTGGMLVEEKLNVRLF